MKEHNSFVLYTDGGSRGNPGPAAIGVVIKNSAGAVLKKYGEYLGETTNNEAEYKAVLFALKKLKALIGKAKAKQSVIHVYADSELLVSHMRGEYKVEHPNMQKLFLELWNLRIDFGRVDFTAVPREQNKEADRLVNEALDAKARSRSFI